MRRGPPPPLAARGPDPAMVLIKISFTHVRDGKPGSLVIPFYLE